ncbi:MAG: divalent-cation tolerance protein CutA [Gammaproteobacteria bacterium]|nr:divalent-cation tolerance protein CutA [Gammaproteobacteria bacterium]
MTPDAILVLTTCADEAQAESLATALLDQRLAACVSRLPGLRSWYRWEGRVNREDEVLVLIKSQADRYPALEAAIVELHDYEVPEILALPVAAGLPAYLAWLTDQLEVPDMPPGTSG